MRDLTNNSIFERVAAASEIEEQEPQGIFQQTAAYSGHESMLRRREAENTFNFIWDNQDEDADAIINLTDHYSKKYGVSRSDALYNLDGYIRDDMGRPLPKKAAWQQISDGFTEGRLTDRIGRLSNQLMWASNDNEKKRIQLEIDKLEQRMPNHAFDRGGFVGAVSSASNLFGTMVRPMGVSIVAGLATAGLGTIPAVAAFAKDAPRIASIGSKILSALPTFNETRKIETGLIYKDMIENGVPEEIAKKNAIAHGIIAGALETASIEVLFARFPFAKKIAQNSVLRMTARERMAQGTVKSIGKIIADNAVSIPIGIVSETATEIWQEQSAIYFEKRADLQSIDDKELGKILADKQGEFERYFDEDFRKQKKEYYASDEYAKEVKDRIWEVAKQTAQGMLVLGLLGGGVNAVNDMRTVAKKDIPYRQTYKNLEKLKTDTDKLREERDKLRNELNLDPQNAEKKAAYEKKNEELAAKEKELNMTDEAREYAELSMKTSLSDDEVDRLVELNDRLVVRRDFREDTTNFDKAPEDIKHEAPQTLDVGEKRLREIVKNYTPMLSEEETDELMNLLNVRARSAGMDLDMYLKTTFQDEMAQFSENDMTTITDKNGVQREVRYKGNVEFAEDGKAIITLTKNADFSTWVHELGHIFRRQIGGELLAEAERHYGVQNGVWTEEAEERFTEDLTTYLRTRRAPSTLLEKMFRIIADALNNVYDRYKERGEVSDDIARMFDQMFAEPGNAFQTTEQAVEKMQTAQKNNAGVDLGPEVAYSISRDEYTDDFRRIQEDSERLIQENTPTIYQRGDRKLDESTRRTLAAAYERLLATGSGSVNRNWTDLTGKGNTFKFAQFNGQLFYDIFRTNRNYLLYGELVDLHEVQTTEEKGTGYEECKCFLSSDGLCGFAIEPDGNLISVFSLNSESRGGFLYAIKDYAVQQGATHLDAFMSSKQPLQEIYEKTLGFKPVAIMDHNMDFDHDEIAKNHGSPKVVFMVRTDADVEVRNFTKDQYDEAAAYQKNLAPATLFQAVGEKGAMRLDQNEQTKERMANLSRAIEMKDKHYGPLYIKKATGWEIGPDKKWRYETPDIVLNKSNPTFTKITKNEERYDDAAEEYILLRDKHSVFLQKPMSDWTEEERKEFKQTEDRMRRSLDLMTALQKQKQDIINELVNQKDYIYLKDFIELDNDVVKAYPSLQVTTTLKFIPESKMDGADGAFYYQDNAIHLKAELLLNPDKMRSVLAHEIQHAIQFWEGFYLGGSDEMFKLDKDGLVDLSPWGINEKVDPYEAYTRIFGEVEARNIQKRLGLTQEERENSTLRSTEDVQRIKQFDPFSKPGLLKLNQIIGEIGAITLDSSELTNNRYLNLQMAKSLDGKESAKSIRLATGWEKGKDGKWRYEIPDIELGDHLKTLNDQVAKLNDDLLAAMNEIPAEHTERFLELLGIPSWQKTPEERQEMRALEEEDRANEQKVEAIRKKRDKARKKILHKEFRLEELVQGKELFAAYPSLKDYKAIFDNDKGMNYASGAYNSETDTLTINIDLLGKRKDGVIDTLVHEIQHAIQKKEGFYKGGNTGMFFPLTLHTIKIRAEMLPDSDPTKKARLDAVNDMLKTHADTEKFVDLSPWGLTGQFAASAYEAYERLAGEVEARTVEERLDLDKRRSTLIAETQEKMGFPQSKQIPLLYGQAIPYSQNRLYQLEEDTYRIATENGNYVPDYILENMRGQEWVEDELGWREEFRKEAVEYDTYEQFLEAMISGGGLRKDSYYENIWDTRDDSLPKYEAMLPHLSRRMLERMLYVIKRNAEQKKGVYPEGMLGEAAKKYEKDHMISEEEYQALMDEIKSAPDKSVVFIEECFADRAEFEDMMKSLWLHPDLEVLRIQELERVIKSNDRLAKFKISSLEERLEKTREKYKGKLADQKAYYLEKEKRQREARKERELYNKLVRQIFRKIPKMCDITIANKIAEIQSMYSPSTMMEKTRVRLELALMDATDERQKAKILNKLSRKSLRDMTLAEVAELASLITQMRHEGVQKRMEQLLAIKERRLDIEAGLIKDTGEGNLDRTGSIESKKDKGSLLDRMKSYWWDINRITEDMGEHWHEFFSEEVGKAYREELKNISRRRSALVEKMKSLGLSNKSLRKTEEIDGKTYTHDILMHWYICMQNNDSAAALVFGNFKDDPNREATIKAGIDKLSDAEIELAEWMIESFSGDDRVRLWDVFRSVENRSPEIILRYFPMIRLLTKVQDVQNEPLVDLGERTHAGRAAVKKNFSFERIHNIAEQNQTPLKLGAMSTYLQAIQNQEHYIAFAQLSKDMKYVYNGVSDAVIARYGQNFYDNINKWIDRVINPNAYKARYAQQNMFMKALANSMAGALAGNVVTMIKQVPSMLFFLPYTDAGHMAQSLYNFATDHKRMTEFAKEKSPYLANRNIDDYLTNLSEQLNDPNSRYRMAKEITGALLKPIQWMDEFACVVGWNSVYTSEMAKGRTEAEAIAKADEALLKTQPQATAIYSPQAYNSGSDLMRTMLVFTRQANQIFQMMTADMGHLLAEKHIKQVLSMGFVLGMNALLMGWISRKFGGYGDDDDESAAMDVTKDIIANLANNIPVVGPTIVPMIQRSAYTSSGYVNPISEMLNKTHRAVYKSIKAGEVDFDTAMRLITDSMGVAGLPKVLTWRAYKALKDEDIWTLFIGSPLGGKDGSK